MIFGHLSITPAAIITHRDSYDLDQITVVSVRRPMLVPALFIGGGMAGFSLIFADLLYGGELTALCGFGLMSLAIGLWLGQLKLLSRDLRQSELVDAVWGSYRTLNGLRLRIHAAKRKLVSEDLS
ncbi:MAG: hypothetical protein AAF903_09175 [Pseudomonadota bacterium]